VKAVIAMVSVLLVFQMGNLYLDEHESWWFINKEIF
jgi:hypothetical protein